MTDLNTTLIGAFLDNLEKARSNSSRSRNLRLTAIRSFFRYTAMDGDGVPRALGRNPARTRDPTKTAIQPIGGFPDET
jgi:site-specific recombinase XerD